MDSLVNNLRAKGPQHMMVEAADQLQPSQRMTAFAVAAEIMRSDGAYLDDELNILDNLADVLELDASFTAQVMTVMDALHADLSVPAPAGCLILIGDGLRGIKKPSQKQDG